MREGEARREQNNKKDNRGGVDGFKIQNRSTKKNSKERRTQTESKKRKHAPAKRALLYSPLAETRLTVYRQRQVKSNTGALVASWHPRRRATIHENDMKNKGFDKCY